MFDVSPRRQMVSVPRFVSRDYIRFVRHNCDNGHVFYVEMVVNADFSHQTIRLDELFYIAGKDRHCPYCNSKDTTIATKDVEVFE